MFTGIIEEIGKLQSFRDQGGKRYLEIKCQKINKSLKVGDSVCCNGVCLTVTAFTGKQITLEVMHETLTKTTIRWWQYNEKINLERALPLSGRLDGHFVQGHVDTVAKLMGREQEGETLYLWFDLPAEYKDLVTQQGSIAVNGVSLTVAKLEERRFAVALISHTLQETNLAGITKYANLEFDILGKYIVRYLRNREKPVITTEWLREQGF